MRKFVTLLLATVLLFGLTSCSGSSSQEESKPPKPPLGEDGTATVLLDAGHGFRDVGCTSEYLNGLYEYELTMDFTERLAEKLRSAGIAVLLTHNGESYLGENELIQRAKDLNIDFESEKIADNGIFDAYERAVYANALSKEREIDLFFSIHVNANADTNEATGFEIDYCAENASSEMSAFAFGEICSVLEKNYPARRLKKFADSWDMSFVVNKYTSMPSILFETGFASTPSDASLLLDESWREELTERLAEGMISYFALEIR